MIHAVAVAVSHDSVSGNIRRPDPNRPLIGGTQRSHEPFNVPRLMRLRDPEIGFTTSAAIYPPHHSQRRLVQKEILHIKENKGNRAKQRGAEVQFLNLVDFHYFGEIALFSL